MKMKKSFFLIVILVFILFDWFVLQMSAENENTFNAGIKSYNLANMKKRSGEPKGELDFLLKSYDIFKNLVSDYDYRPLIMGYVIYQRFQSPQVQALSKDLIKKIPASFFQPEAIEEYVKNEYGKGFPTIEKMDFLASDEITRSDKQRLLEDLNKIAEKKQQKAKALVEVAREYRRQAEYKNAVKKLEQALDIWNLPEALVLLDECKVLEEKRWQIRADYENLMAQKRYSEATALLREASGVLSDEEIASKEDKTKTLWSNDLYNKAKMYYEKRDLPKALDLVDDSLGIKDTAKAENLKKEIKKRMKKSSFFVNLGVSNDFKNTMDYEWTGNSNSYAEVSDKNHIESDGFDKSTSMGAGFIYLFSPPYGIMVSVSSIKQKWKFYTEYIFYWKWWDDTSATSSSTMSESADASMTLINIDLIFAENIFSDLYLNLYAGPTIYFSDVDLYAGIGYGGVWWTQNYQQLFPEWFPFKYNIRESGVGIGGNIGGGLEYKIPPFGIFMDFQYYILLSKEYDWKLISQRYDGGFGYFYVDSPEENLSNLPGYKMKLNLSTYKISVGVRFYF